MEETKKNDNENAKIYVIRNHSNDLVYVGATTQRLSSIMSRHRYNAMTAKQKRKLYNAIRSIGPDNFYIELLEAYPCQSREELSTRNGHWIRTLDSYNNGYNGKIENRKMSKWCNEYEVVEDDKTKIKCESLKCECGGKYTLKHKAKHIKTKKHQKYIQRISNSNNNEQCEKRYEAVEYRTAQTCEEKVQTSEDSC